MKIRRHPASPVSALPVLASILLAAAAASAGDGSETILTSKNFVFEINGMGQDMLGVEPGEVNLARCKPGALRCELQDATQGDRKLDEKDFTVSKVQWGSWRVEKYYSSGDTSLKDLFQSFANGQRKMNPTDTLTLRYLDGDGTEARRITCFGFTPLHYEYINVDTRNPGQAATEMMEFEVGRCEYVALLGGPGVPGGDDGDVVVAAALTSSDPSTGGDVTDFQLDLMQGGEGPAQNWYAIRGGAQTLHRKHKTNGHDHFVSTDSGDVKFSEVEVVGPFVSGGTRAELLQVLNQWATPSRERFNATLELLDSNQQVVRTINFFECIPTHYSPPSVRAGDDSLLEERFAFKAERVEG